MTQADHRHPLVRAVSVMAVVGRIVALVIAVLLTGVFLWLVSLGDLSSLWLPYWLISIPCMAVVSLLPRVVYRFLPVRVGVASLCTLSILLTLPMMHHDLSFVDRPDVVSFLLRCIQVLALAALTLEAIAMRRVRPQTQACETPS